MSYIQFDKTKLINLSYSLNQELLRSNRSGAYSSTTLIFCNTRKYHGLLVTPQPMIDDELHVLVSGIDPTIIQHDAEFHLGIHKYPDGKFYPKGHKYMREIIIDSIPKIIYRVGGVVFSIENLFSSSADRMLIKYTVEDCNSPTTLRLQPFLAFRQRHRLSKANNFIDKSYKISENGVNFKLYQGYTSVHFQFSKNVEYIHTPDWYYNIEYEKEKARGYEFSEDLFVPGFFEFNLKKGESIILSVGTEEVKTTGLTRMYNNEKKERKTRDSFRHSLENAADQFIQKRDGKTDIIAGFPWFGVWGRDTFISLPGLTLSTKRYELAKAVLDTMSKRLNGPLFPNVGTDSQAAFNSIDAPLWYFWSVQQYTYATGKYDEVWKSYGKKMLAILEGYKNGSDFNIRMLENGLISGGIQGKALTWMDAVVEGKAVTPRIGMPVEINVLWYNAIKFFIELAEKVNNKTNLKIWNEISENIKSSFTPTFWDESKGYLADYVDGDYKNWDIRPNMIFAASLPFSPVSDYIKAAVVNKVKEELLTIRGLRTLSPSHPNYKGVYEGNQRTRDNAYHQGTVWPWLFGHYAEAYLKIRMKTGVTKMEWYLEQFEQTMYEHGIGTISEIYDGDPPHTSRGAISQAWSVAEILRVMDLVEKLKSEK